MTPSHPSIILIPYHFASRDSLMKNACIFPGFPVDSAAGNSEQLSWFSEIICCYGNW
jgi:hypothetical protein